MTETDNTIATAGARLRASARAARWRHRRHLAARYDRDRFFRSAPPDLVGFEVFRLGSGRAAMAGDPTYTEDLIGTLRRRLARVSRRHGPELDGSLQAPRSETETLRVAILGEIAILRRQRAAKAQVEALTHMSALLGGTESTGKNGR